jgi:hypothetical protein
MEKKGKKDLSKNKLNSKTIINKYRSKKLSQKKNKTPINTMTIKIERKNKNVMNINKFMNHKYQNKKIAIKKYSMDNRNLNIDTNDIKNTLESNASDFILNKKIELKTETYNNKTIIPKNIKENFGTIILQKKMKLFNFSNEIEENDNNIDTNKIKGKTEHIHKKKLKISIKKVDKEKSIENKILYKKLKLNLIKDNNSNNNENNLKLETKINKNREKLFNTKNDKNEILKEQKEKKIILLKNKDKKLYNSNENIIKKKKEVEPSNNTDNKNKEEINKDKLINFQKSINPITINIDLADDNNSNIINEKLPEKILLSSDRISPDNKERIKFHHKIQRKKLENKKILIDDKIKEKKEIKENTSIKKDNTEKPRKKVSKIREYNIETFTPNESRDIKKRKIINNSNNILLNTIETNILGKKAINKILGNNHYKALFTDIYGVDREKETNTKKKFKFSERKKDKTNKGFNIRLTESSESYYDLYKKAFNDTSIEQKFSFKPKINKKYFNSEYSNTNEFNDENNKTYDNTKKISSLSFNSKREKSLKDFDEFDNNKNDILDLNHFIPIDENKLIYTFNKPLFGDKNKN